MYFHRLPYSNSIVQAHVNYSQSERFSALREEFFYFRPSGNSPLSATFLLCFVNFSCNIFAVEEKKYEKIVLESVKHYTGFKNIIKAKFISIVLFDYENFPN